MLKENDIKLFQAINEEQDKEVEDFLDGHGIPKFKGRTFIKQMIIYTLNKKIYQRVFNEELYYLVAELNGTTRMNVVRLVRYACYEGNKEKPIYPINIMYDAWNRLKCKEEVLDYEDIGNGYKSISWSERKRFHF